MQLKKKTPGIQKEKPYIIYYKKRFKTPAYHFGEFDIVHFYMVPLGLVLACQPRYHASLPLNHATLDLTHTLT